MSSRHQQTAAIAKYMEEHGSIDNFTALTTGIPDVGRVLRLGARIYDLRQGGYEIATEMQESKNTIYRLVAVPGPKQLPLNLGEVNSVYLHDQPVRS